MNQWSTLKKGDKILGVRSSALHARVKAYVDAAHSEDVTISSVVRDAIREKVERLEKVLEASQRGNSAAGKPITSTVGDVSRQAALIHKAQLAREAGRSSSSRSTQKRTPDAQ